jgi:hypothetical protein
MLLATGKANIEHPPRAFVDIAIRNVAGSITFLTIGAPATFAAVEDQQLVRMASNDSAIGAFENYKTYLEQELKLKADGDFALGSDLFGKRMAYNEMVDIPPDRLLDIAYAQLHKDQAALSEAAASAHRSDRTDGRSLGAARGHIDGRSLHSSPRRGWSCDLPATLALARLAAENRRFQLFMPFVLLRIDCGSIHAYRDV